MPTHDFLILAEKDGDYSDYLRHINDPTAIKLDDDLVLHMLDTLAWIPSINPANPDDWQGHGLNHWGPTVINKSGAGKAGRLFRAWAALWQEGPETLELTREFERAERDSSTGRHAVITTHRDSVVKCLIELAALADEAASGRSYILHLGV